MVFIARAYLSLVPPTPSSKLPLNYDIFRLLLRNAPQSECQRVLEAADQAQIPNPLRDSAAADPLGTC